VSDALNQTVVTGSDDRTVKFWDFKTMKMVASAKMDSAVLNLTHHRESGLVAAACGDFSVSVFDIDTRRKVRHFDGHSDRITDMAWSPDGRWLITSSMDASVRTWDLPTGRTISWFAVPEAVTSLSMSPAGDFLATTHVGNLGVYLWANRSLYGAMSLKPIADESAPAKVVSLPVTGGGNSIAGAAAAEGEEGGAAPADFIATAGSGGTGDDGDDGSGAGPVTPLTNGLVTFSELPKSRWANLSSLSDIKRRNKPKEPPKAPKSAPFFLPSVAGLETKFDVAGEGDELGLGTSKVLNFGKIGVMSPFQRALCKAARSENYTPFLETLKRMGPSAIDLEVRSLSLERECEQLAFFLAFVGSQLHKREHYELVQSYLHLFLKVHGDTLGVTPLLQPAMEGVQTAQAASWVHMEGLFQHSIAVLNFLRGGGL
jgi:U3 small nucleolar RNA-associated protein 21